MSLILVFARLGVTTLFDCSNDCFIKERGMQFLVVVKVIGKLVLLCFFFFSSRRRHTRCSRDWSSDVCSSDLVCRLPGSRAGSCPNTTFGTRLNERTMPPRAAVKSRRVRRGTSIVRSSRRSEERRVGKESRSRGRPDDEKKKEINETRTSQNQH